jgi:alpha-ketoglutarate-dependent taurine dioxygenase
MRIEERRVSPEEVVLPPGLTMTPLSSHVGVEVNGVDLDARLEAHAADALCALFERHHLLLLRAPDLSPENQSRFAALFGTESHRERGKRPTSGGDSQYVSNVRADGLFGRGELDYHIDQLFLEEPLRAVILYGLEVPAEGGSTRFVNTQAVCEAMPAALRDRLAGLRCRHARAYDRATTADWNVVDAEVDSPSWVHPLLWRDPRSGKHSIWVNKLTTVGVEGLSDADSAALIAEVRELLYEESFAYHHYWQPGDLLIWDNRVLQHARTPFDPSATRTLRRSAIV